MSTDLEQPCRVYVIKDQAIMAAVRANKVDPYVYRPADIREEVHSYLAEHIRDGKTNWPVETGYSRMGFYSRHDGLWNDAPYAADIESGKLKPEFKGTIDQYVSQNINLIVFEALTLLGAKPKKTRKRFFGLL